MESQKSMTLDEFKATRRVEVRGPDFLRTLREDVEDYDTSTFAFYGAGDELFIEFDSPGRFELIIGSSSFQSESLEALEERLYARACQGACLV